MKIYTHWTSKPCASGELVSKCFFARKSQELQAAHAAKVLGLQVLARHEWQVEPTADAVAKFCNDQIRLNEELVP